jgi:hypothetical protein
LFGLLVNGAFCQLRNSTVHAIISAGLFGGGSGFQAFNLAFRKATNTAYRTSAGAAHTFREAAPIGGFGVWWLCPPHPALAGTACRWALLL